MEALEQAELGRRAVLDAHLRVVAVDVTAKRTGDETRAVVGDQKRHPCQRAVEPLQLLGRAGTQVERELETIIAYATGQAWSGPFELRQKVSALEWSLSSPHWADRKRAAVSLGCMGPDATDAVPALIEAIETSGGSVDPAAASALEAITGQDFGGDAEAWRLWWEEQQ